MTDEERKYEKDQWKQMSLSKKLQHFATYYLWQTVAICAGAVFVIYLIWNFFQPREYYALYVAVFDDYLADDAQYAFADELREILGVDDPKAMITLSGGHSSDNYQDVQLIQVLTANKEIDVIVANLETFRAFAANGYFTNLEEVFTEAELSALGDRVVQEAGWKDAEVQTIDSVEAGQGEVLPYGISIAGSGRWAELSLNGTDDMVAGILVNSSNTENAKLFIETMLQDS